MAKQNRKEAKIEQGYVEKQVKRECATCAHYASDFISETTTDTWRGLYTHVQEKNRRCKIGGFSVKKTAVCKKYCPDGKEDAK